MLSNFHKLNFINISSAARPNLYSSIKSQNLYNNYISKKPFSIYQANTTSLISNNKYNNKNLLTCNCNNTVIKGKEIIRF